jgi:hypothetical protein
MVPQMDDEEEREISIEFDCSDEAKFFDFMVAGVKYEKRPEAIERFAKTNVLIDLVRDHKNKYSEYATLVTLSENGKVLGYVPEEYAEDIAKLIDDGCICKGAIGKMLMHASPQIPVIYAVCDKLEPTVIVPQPESFKINWVLVAMIGMAVFVTYALVEWV